MPRSCAIPAASLFAMMTTVALVFAQSTSGQQTGVHPPPYRGVQTLVPGVYVTPVPGAPFSAVVKLESTQALPDGTSAAKNSVASIARDSQGRIYNERRQLTTSPSAGVPPLLSSLIYDPETRLSTFLNPFTHLAHQRTLPPRPEATAQGPQAGSVSAVPNNPQFKQEDLGTEVMDNVAVHGSRQIRTIPAAVSGTGKDIVVIDEYWYSDELRMNMLTKHSDPRTGTQLITITQVNHTEPDPAIFQIPQGYKIVDETPVNQP